MLVSFGGGSAIDGAEDVAYILAAGMRDIDELNRQAAAHRPACIDRPLLPHIAISTTLSAGEFNPGAAITDERTRVKGTFGHVGLVPRVVLLDPTVTVATPVDLWLSTGIKALDHAVERVYSPHHQPLTDTLCLEAIRLLVRHLPASRPTTDDGLIARGHCQLAAWFSIFGGPKVRTGIGHVIGHQIGARFDAPHGYTSCITMPHVIRFVHRQAPDRIALIATALGLSVPAAEAGEATAQAVARLVADLGLPQRLRDVGVPRAELDGLVAAAAHELSNPLTMIVAGSELLATRAMPAAQQRKLIGDVRVAALHLQGIINDLWDLVRLQRVGWRLDLRVVDLGQLIAEAVALVAPAAERDRITLTLPTGGLRIEADRARLKQVVVNLIGNALKYSPGGGPVRVTCAEDGDSVLIRVSDRGIGIPSEALPSLFQTFYRAPNDLGRDIPGSGLGLAIAKQIVEAHGGTIWAQSPGVGKGSTFTVRLPKAPQARVAPGDEPLA